MKKSNAKHDDEVGWVSAKLKLVKSQDSGRWKNMRSFKCFKAVTLQNLSVFMMESLKKKTNVKGEKNIHPEKKLCI